MPSPILPAFSSFLLRGLLALVLLPLASLPLAAQTSGGGRSLKAPKINDGFIINAPSGYGDRKAPKSLNLEFKKDRLEQTQARIREGTLTVTKSLVHEGTVVRRIGSGGPAGIEVYVNDGKDVQLVLPEEYRTSLLVVDLGGGASHPVPLTSPRLVFDFSKIFKLAAFKVRFLKLTFISPVTLKAVSCTILISNSGKAVLKF